MKYLRFIPIILSFAILLTMIGCESDSDSPTENAPVWVTPENADFSVYVGAFSGYTARDQDGSLLDLDENDWQMTEYTDGISRDGRPVELIRFTAQTTENGMVLLEWATQSEVELLGYYVLRSETGNMDEAIPINPAIISATNTNVEAIYNHIDQHVVSGSTYYYWIQVIANDGYTMVHGPVDIHMSNSAEPSDCCFSFWTNPFTDSATLRCILADDCTARIVLYNQSLDIFFEITDEPITNFQDFEILAENYALTAGLYRVFYNIYDANGNQYKWGYGDILYDPDFEW